MNDRELVRLVWRSWADRGEALTEQEWATPTRLPGWSVRDLYAHAAPDPDLMRAGLEATTDQPPAARCGADLLRMFNAPDGVAHTMAPAIADQARKTAVETDPGRLVSSFRAMLAPAMVELTDGLGDDQCLAHPVVGSVTLRTLVETALVEYTVHLLDLVAAVGGPPVPPAALARARDIVLAVPDPAQLLEAATGRGEHRVLPVMR